MKYLRMPNSNNRRQTKTDCRTWRIFAFAIIFVGISLRRMIYQDLEFLTKILLDDAVAVGGAYLSSSSAATKYASARGADLVIFYNLYIPPQDDTDGVLNAINVIEDQMEQIASVLQRIEIEQGGDGNQNGNSINEKKGVVLYNLIGNEDAFPSDKMSELCHQLHPRLDCQLIRYYEEASEAVTLQDVHDYCTSAPTSTSNLAQQSKNATTTTTSGDRVVYLHSKGSYHSQPENHIWRKQMTAASLHPDCLNPPDDTCDVCGAQFYIKYAMMFPGNMWTAKCSYIRKLIPPNTGEYERRKVESIKHFLMLRLWGVLQATLDTDNVEHYGIDRYQWEHWIAHPSIRPCEVHTTDVGPLILVGKDQQGREFGPDYYDWGMGPRRISHNLGGLRVPRLRLERNEELQFREYYYLPGNLLKWFHLYGPEGVPEQGSWVWRDFPAGQRWKELVGRHGENAVDVMVKESNPRFHSAFAQNTSSSLSLPTSGLGLLHEETSTLLSHPNPPIVVFYQISFPPDDKAKALATVIVQAQFDVLSMGQYDNNTNTFDQTQKVLLYYTISGGSSQQADHVSNLCKEKSNRITCRQLGRYNTDKIGGETLHQLHTFCNAKPMFNVIYITNQLSGFAHRNMDNSAITQKVQAITSAVMSKMCHPSDQSCNVCGTEFYPLPFLHFIGNTFSTSCGYVANLLPPPVFEERMNELAANALLSQLEEVHTTKLIGFNARILGSYQHSIEHWIGSHPNLKPCDVAPLNEAKKVDGTITILDQMKQYSWSLAPRRGSAPPGHLTSHDGEIGFRKKREVALREYYYLAGNVFRWHGLYGKVPDTNSWVWKYFPDGQIWETAAQNSGKDAVHELVKQLSNNE